MTMKKNYNTVLCRYAEIAIKGQNRGMFERALVTNIRRLLNGISAMEIRRVRGRIWIRKHDGAVFSESEIDIVRKQMPKAFGLSSFSPGWTCPPQVQRIEELVRQYAPGQMSEMLAGKGTNGGLSFRVRVNRSWKNFPMNSKELEIALADCLEPLPFIDRLTVDLNHAEFTIGCDLRHEFAFVFFETCPGPGGLPVGSNKPVLCLLSGGIDSPVAAMLMMKRGCPVDYITFHSDPYTPPETLEKVERLTKVMNQYQLRGRLFACNLVELQKLIRDNCTERFRTVLYRRMMFRIAGAIAERHGQLAMVTGECVGQVASQTIVNLSTIDAATDMLVLRPLIGMDKDELTRLARKYGTFEISKEQVPDSCTVFAPDSPATAAHLKFILREEEKFAWHRLIDEMVEQTIAATESKTPD